MILKRKFWKKKKFILQIRLQNPIVGQLRQSKEKFDQNEVL